MTMTDDPTYENQPTHELKLELENRLLDKITHSK